MRIAAGLMPAIKHRRVAERISTNISAGFRERGRTGFAVNVVDLSTHGCKIEFAGSIVIGSHAWLKLPNLESWYTKVAWLEEGQAGLDFVRPLHPAVAAAVAAEPERQFIC